MITVETIPQRFTAVQWHRPGDCVELVKPYRLGTEERWGVHSAARGFQRVQPGDWIVFDSSEARVYGPGEFHHKFRIIEEERTTP